MFLLLHLYNLSSYNVTCRRSLTSCGDCSSTPISRANAANGSIIARFSSAAGIWFVRFVRVRLRLIGQGAEVQEKGKRRGNVKVRFRVRVRVTEDRSRGQGQGWGSCEGWHCSARCGGTKLVHELIAPSSSRARGASSRPPY